MNAHLTDTAAPPAAPAVVTRLFTEAGEPFGVELSGGVVVTKDGRTLAPTDLFNAPAQADATAEPEPPQAPQPASVNLPDPADLWAERDGRKLEVFANDLLIATVQPHVGASVRMHLYCCPTAWTANLKLRTIGSRDNAVAEIKRAFELSEKDEARLTAVLLKIAELWERT